MRVYKNAQKETRALTRSLNVDSLLMTSPYVPLMNGEPSWLFYACSQNDTLLAVDVDVTDRIMQDYVLPENWEAYQESKDWNLRRSYTRFVYTRHLQTGKEQGFFMTIVPSKICADIYSYRMRRNTYLHRDRALSGYVLFHNLDGTFSNGWEYKHGQVVDRIVSPRKAKRLGLTGPALVLYRCEASYEVSLKMDNQSRIQTRSTGESDFLDDGSYLLDEVIVVGHGGGGGVPFYPGSGGVSTGGSSGGGSSGGSSGHGGSGSKNPGGYEPDFPEDDNTPPTAKNFIEKVITEALKKNVRTILKIEPDDIRVIVTNIQSENPMALAAYKDGKIYIYNKMFKSNLTRTDMESCVFHEFVHATQPPLPTDEKGNVLTKEYDVQYTGIELQDAESDFIDILQKHGIPLYTDPNLPLYKQITEKQEFEAEILRQMYLGPFFTDDMEPRISTIKSNLQHVKNEAEAYRKQWDKYSGSMSSNYSYETWHNLRMFEDLYKQIKDL